MFVHLAVSLCVACFVYIAQIANYGATKSSGNLNVAWSAHCNVMSLGKTHIDSSLIKQMDLNTAKHRVVK